MTSLKLTDRDLDIVCLCPDGWFDDWDLPPTTKKSRYRCERLVSLGFLEQRVVGKIPILNTQYHRTQKADEWLATQAAIDRTQRLSTTHGDCKNWRIRYNMPKM